MAKRYVCFIVTCILLLSPTVTFADGGGPLLLFINLFYFLFGSVAILGGEWLVYRYRGGLFWKNGFFDALIANFSSTVVVGFGLPFAIAALSASLGYLTHNVSEKISGLLIALGTWVVGDHPLYPKIALIMIPVWLIVTFLLTVRFEAWILQKRGKRRGEHPTITPLKLSWFSNSLSYLGLVAILFFGLKEFR